MKSAQGPDKMHIKSPEKLELILTSAAKPLKMLKNAHLATLSDLRQHFYDNKALSLARYKLT